MTRESFEERREKYVSGLLIRAIVCVVFVAVFAVSAYLAAPEVRRHFIAVIVLLVGLALANWPFWLVGKKYRFPLGHFYGHWVIDLLSVTLLVHILGGIELPYGSVGYMIMILTSAVFLSERAAFVVATGSALCFDSLVMLEYSGMLGQFSQVWQHQFTGAVQVFIVLAANVFFYLFAYLAGSLAQQLKAANIALSKARDDLTVYAATLETKVSERTAALEVKNREIAEFVHIVTHDLRNVAVGAAELARRLLTVERDRFSAKGARYASNLLEDTRHMDGMLSSLLALLRIDNEGEQPVATDVGQLVAELVDANALRLEAKGIKVKVDSLPTVCVDRVQLKHVLANLLDNAIKYSGDKPDPMITVECSNQEARCVVAIRDNGIGIPFEQQERIFDLYHRGAAQIVAGEELEGHGVGLAMAKRIVERWGGTIWVESQSGVGSVFFFSCPETSDDQRLAM